MKMKEIGSREGRAPLAPSPRSDNEIVKSPPEQYPVIHCIIDNDNLQYMWLTKIRRPDTVRTKIPFFQKMTEKTVFVKYI